MFSNNNFILSVTPLFQLSLLDERSVLDNLYVTENDRVKGYKIDSSFYFDEFYPFMSVLFNNYCPLIYQIIMGERIMFSLETEGITKGIPLFEKDRLYDLSNYVASHWNDAEEYDGSLDGYKYKLIINDFVVKKELYVFDNYLNIDGRKIATNKDIDFIIDCLQDIFN